LLSASALRKRPPAVSVSAMFFSQIRIQVIQIVLDIEVL
jgi:hypothetical protein